MTNEEYREEMYKKIDDPLTWIGNYFYNTSKYTVKGSPYCKDGGKYKLTDWLNCYNQGCKTSSTMIGIGVDRGYISESKEYQSGSIDDVLCGRNERTQYMVDFTVELFIDKNEA
tara:strand:- start:44 stop:385 length:342 start_codon:yes stop_codon:yes gene_type:complete